LNPGLMEYRQFLLAQIRDGIHELLKTPGNVKSLCFVSYNESIQALLNLPAGNGGLILEHSPAQKSMFQAVFLLIFQLATVSPHSLIFSFYILASFLYKSNTSSYRHRLYFASTLRQRMFDLNPVFAFCPATFGVQV
jgi:hypothetical protein